jgi:membrane-associated phospholipid phosphatase
MAVLITALYLLGSYIFTGLRSDQVTLAAIFNILFFSSALTRKFITGFSIFLLYWVLFDWMKAFPNYLFNEVSIKEIYEAEKSMFGIHTVQGKLTPNEYLALHQSATADIISGLFYMCWVPLPWGYAVYLFFKNRRGFFHYALAFFLMNMIGFIVYYVYPAAPPWFVSQFGFDFIPGIPGNTAGLARFDALTGTDIFASIYNKSSNVYAAMPSMHAGDIFLATVFTYKNKSRITMLLFTIFAIGICVSAVYTNHHYVLDVVAGISCALLSIFLLRIFLRSTNAGKKFMNFLISKTT